MVEYFQPGLLGHPGRNTEGNVEGNLNYDNPTQEVSEEKNINKWLGD